MGPIEYIISVADFGDRRKSKHAVLWSQLDSSQTFSLTQTQNVTKTHVHTRTHKHKHTRTHAPITHTHTYTHARTITRTLTHSCRTFGKRFAQVKWVKFSCVRYSGGRNVPNDARDAAVIEESSENGPTRCFTLITDYNANTITTLINTKIMCR